jgi:hypothetical protein
MTVKNPNTKHSKPELKVELVASREQIPYNVHQNCSRVDQSTGRLAKFATAQYALDILGYNVWPVIKVKQFQVIL